MCGSSCNVFFILFFIFVLCLFLLMEPAMHLVGTACFCCPPRVLAAAFLGSSFLTVTTPRVLQHISAYWIRWERSWFVCQCLCCTAKEAGCSLRYSHILPVEKSQAKEVFGTELWHLGGEVVGSKVKLFFLTSSVCPSCIWLCSSDVLVLLIGLPEFHKGSAVCWWLHRSSWICRNLRVWLAFLIP